jgi:predicted nucleic acid-binding protein
LEQYASDQWVISDLERMECLVGALKADDQLRLLAFRSFFADCEVLPLTAEVFDRAAHWRAQQRLSTHPAAPGISSAARAMRGPKLGRSWA